MSDNKTDSPDLGTWLIATKWMPPRHHVPVVNRLRLINTLNKGLKYKLSVITAPAGFGKTTLASNWCDHLLSSGNKVAWLTLDEADEDINNLLSYIVSSLAYAGVYVGKLEMLAEQGLSDTTPRACLAALVNYLTQEPQQVFLILDDYQRIMSSEVDNFMDNLMEVMPDNFHMVINSRERSQLDLARLLSLGKLLELTPDDLRFDFTEMKEALGINLDQRQLEELLDKTEGWAVTIQLAKFAIEADDNHDQVIQSFSGKSHYLAEYLSEQVLNKCSPITQEFLLKTSILERVNGDLANAVCGFSHNIEQVNNLGNINALMVPIDDENHWFRYHHLFSDFLNQELKQHYPNEENTLHLRASDWFAEQGNLAEAVRHACKAENFDRAAYLIKDAGGWELILFGGIGFLRNLLRHIPKERLQYYPRLQIAKAYLLQKTGCIKEARTYIELAQNNLRLLEPDYVDNISAYERDYEMVSTLQGTYEDDNNKKNYLKMKDGLERVAAADGIFSGVLYCALTLTKMATAEFNQGLDYIQKAVKSMRQANSVLGLNYCYLHLGQLAFYQGNLNQATAYFSEARNMAEENFGSDSGLKFLADVLLSSLLDWRGELGSDLTRFNQGLEHTEQFDGWFEIYISAYEVILYRAIKENRAEPLEKLRDRCQSVYLERGIERLNIFVQCCNLLICQFNGNTPEAEKIVYQLEEYLNNDNWENNLLQWRPFQYIGLILSKWYVQQGEINKAHSVLEELENCNRKFGVKCFLINALVTRAGLFFHTNKLEESANKLFEASALAWPENIKRPFTESEYLLSMVSSTLKTQHEKSADKLTLNFLQECVIEAKKSKKHTLTKQGILSSREMEVLIELQGGLSNKEIARALEMTEHTVKFHMKNIFRKLNVDKRARAIIVARQMRLLD